MTTTDKFATMFAMVARGSTVAEMCKRTGLTRQTVYKKLRALERARVARISQWNKDDTGRTVEPVWVLGQEPSVERSRQKSADKQRAYRQRKHNELAAMKSMAATILTTASAGSARKRGQ
jgi:transcription initiation factor IIE alpha subunit